VNALLSIFLLTSSQRPPNTLPSQGTSIHYHVHHIITSSHHKTSHSTKHLSIQHSNLQSNPIYTLNTTALCTFPLAKTDHFVPRSLVAYMGPLLMYLERLVRLFPLLLLARPRPPLALVLELPLAAPPVAFWPAF
jgi:hypothetical protein